MSLRSNDVLFEPAGTGKRVRIDEVTRLLDAAVAGDPDAAAGMLPGVYQLQRVAAVRMAIESPGHTLHPTALVHKAWARPGTDPPGGPLPEPFGVRPNPEQVIRLVRARPAQQ